MKKHVVTIYSRPDCHLCLEAKANIMAARSRDSFDIEEINIDTDDVLREKYGYDVPVVLINGIKVFKHTVDTREFERKLDRFSRPGVG
jgi:glutaredoxin